MSIEISIKNNVFTQKAYLQDQFDDEHKGKQVGETNILCRLLEKKFGPLPPSLEER